MESTKKMGRPKVEHPKTKSIQIRLSDVEYDKVQDCAKRNNLTMTQLLRQGMQNMIDSLEKSQ